MSINLTCTTCGSGCRLMYPIHTLVQMWFVGLQKSYKDQRVPLLKFCGWTLHGLWTNAVFACGKHSELNYENLRDERYSKDVSATAEEYRQAIVRLKRTNEPCLEALTNHWLSANSANNEGFRKHQYIKHGAVFTKSLPARKIKDVDTYLCEAMRLHKEYDIGQYLTAQPGSTCKLSQISKDINEKIKQKPFISCETIGSGEEKTNLLTEIRLYFDKDLKIITDDKIMQHIRSPADQRDDAGETYYSNSTSHSAEYTDCEASDPELTEDETTTSTS